METTGSVVLCCAQNGFLSVPHSNPTHNPSRLRTIVFQVLELEWSGGIIFLILGFSYFGLFCVGQDCFTFNCVFQSSLKSHHSSHKR